MIALRELFKPEDAIYLSDDIRANLSHLHYKLNLIRMFYKEDMVVSRGFSTPQEQIKIYQAKGQTPKMGSQHLLGGAADILDPQQQLQKFVLNHLEWFESLNVWIESFSATPTWTHFQIYPYASWEPGKSIFFEP